MACLKTHVPGIDTFIPKPLLQKGNSNYLIQGLFPEYTTP